MTRLLFGVFCIQMSKGRRSNESNGLMHTFFWPHKNTFLWYYNLFPVLAAPGSSMLLIVGHPLLGCSLVFGSNNWTDHFFQESSGPRFCKRLRWACASVFKFISTNLTDYTWAKKKKVTKHSHICNNQRTWTKQTLAVDQAKKKTQSVLPKKFKKRKASRATTWARLPRAGEDGWALANGSPKIFPLSQHVKHFCKLPSGNQYQWHIWA